MGTRHERQAEQYHVEVPGDMIVVIVLISNGNGQDVEMVDIFTQSTHQTEMI